jgi:SAM-dependent methyltransferase
VSGKLRSDSLNERKQLERDYYDRGAKRVVTDDAGLRLHGPAGIDEHLRAPYVEYQSAIERLSRPGALVLDLGAGTGANSFIAPRDAGPVLATDISASSLAIAKSRGEVLGRELLAFAGDAEQLPLRNHSVDICTSAGVLYCLDLPSVIAEVSRVLKSSGSWVMVDSFNHSPIYRLNRLVGYWSGRRTKRAYTSIPNEETLVLFRRRFADVSVSYFGVWSFLWPLLRRLLGRRRATIVLAALEPPNWLCRYAFKIVVVARFPSIEIAHDRIPANT